VTASTALDSSGTAADKSLKAEVKTVLIGLLPPGTRRSSRECWDAIKKETGCSSGSIVTAAKSDLGIISAREEFSGGWYWEMPAHSAEDSSRARITESGTLGNLGESWNLGRSQDSPCVSQDSIQTPQDSAQTPKIPQDSTFQASRARERECMDCRQPTGSPHAARCATCYDNWKNGGAPILGM
jgi:hypothetical protein